MSRRELVHFSIALACSNRAQDVCIERGIDPAPVIISESGRALGSHHAILVFDVLSKCVSTRA